MAARSTKSHRGFVGFEVWGVVNLPLALGLGTKKGGKTLGAVPGRTAFALFGAADQGTQLYSQRVGESLADEYGWNTIPPFEHNHACPTDSGGAGKLILGKLLPLPLGTEYRPQAFRELVWIFLLQERSQLTTNRSIRVCPRGDKGVRKRTMPN